MSGGGVRAIVVVVPVHDEEALLGRSLAALGAAVGEARRQGVRCEVRIVLDSSTDASAAIAARHPFPVLVCRARCVGGARAAGIAAALEQVAAIPPSRVWIANTDADSAVPSDWLTDQRFHADRGADVYLGTVRPDFADLTPRHRRHWLDSHVRGRPNGHVHGASLGIRASRYLEVGGFADLAEHEDVDLVERCVRSGAPTAASDAAEVLTSGRHTGRTPGGYARYLREQARTLG